MGIAFANDVFFIPLKHSSRPGGCPVLLGPGLSHKVVPHTVDGPAKSEAPVDRW